MKILLILHSVGTLDINEFSEFFKNSLIFEKKNWFFEIFNAFNFTEFSKIRYFFKKHMDTGILQNFL